MAVKKKSTKKAPRKTSKKKEITTVVVAQDKAPDIDQDSEKPVLEPRQALYLEYYYDNKSSTWGNARQSAIRAGFSEEYANTITYLKPKWLSEFIGRQDISGLIEQHIAETLSLPTVTQAMGAFGPIEKTETFLEDTGEVYKTGKRKGEPKFKKTRKKVPVMLPNMGIIKEKTAVAKLAAPAHNPDKYGKKATGGNTFNFNMSGDRQKYT